MEQVKAPKSVGTQRVLSARGPGSLRLLDPLPLYPQVEAVADEEQSEHRSSSGDNKNLEGSYV